MPRSRRARTSVAFALAALGTFGGCSLFVSVDGLQGSDGGTSDDGSIASDAPVDSRADGTSGADGSIVDAGVDSCVFCDDFDDRTSGLGPWADNSGTYEITTAEYRSAPHSVHFKLGALASGYQGINLSTPIPLPNGELKVDFDVKVATDISTAGGYFNILGMGLNDTYAGSVTANAGNWASDFWVSLPDAGHLQTTFGAGVAPDQTWHHFQYVITYEESKGSFTAFFDGTQFGTVTGVETYPSEPPPTTVTLSIGMGENADLPAIDIYIDNVAVHY